MTTCSVTATVQRQRGVEDRPVPLDRSASSASLPGDRAVQRRLDELVQDLAVIVEQLEAAEDHQVVLVAQRAGAAAERAGPVEVLVGGAVEQGVERAELARLAAARALAVDLLQAQHVGAQAHQLRAQQPDPLLQRRRRRVGAPRFSTLKVAMRSGDGGFGSGRAHRPAHRDEFARQRPRKATVSGASHSATPTTRPTSRPWTS